jgi:hypothetical protein
LFSAIRGSAVPIDSTCFSDTFALIHLKPHQAASQILTAMEYWSWNWSVMLIGVPAFMDKEVKLITLYICMWLVHIRTSAKPSSTPTLSLTQ